MNRQVLELNGSLFEAIIAQTLQREISDSYTILNKELFSYQLQKETQIDVILVTSKALFVVEAKNWTEWIKGNYDDDFWLGKSRSRNVMRVVSPYRQNFMHIRALRNSAARNGITLPPIINLICLPNGAVFESDCKELHNFSNLVPTVREHLEHLAPVCNPIELLRIVKSLK